jgi:hypothetical protein
MEYVLLTFPRCGSHYLQQLIYQKTGLFIRKTHHISEVGNRHIISIIRSPEDTFRSMTTMKRFYTENKAMGIGVPIDSYVEFYEHLIDNASILVDYEDLVSKPDKVVAAIAKHLNLEVMDVEYKDVLFDKPQHKYLVTSKKSDEYHKIDLSKFDLFKPNMAYADALLNCITV